MHNTHFRPARTIVYASLAQERAWGCDHPLGDPWGGAAYGEFNKGGFFSNSYWEGGGIVKSVVSFVKDPVGYTSDRLKELDKTVIQPIGHGLEKVGQGIANDPLTFIATVAAVVAQQYWAIPLITMASTAAKGGSFEDVLKAGAISAATTFIGVQGSDLLMGQMAVQAGTQTTYQIAGQAISKTTAQVIAQSVSYGASGALGAAATGKNVGVAALTGAITGGVAGATSGLAQSELLKDFSSAIDGVTAKGVGTAISNAIAGAAGQALAGAITGRDTSTQIGMALVGGAVNGITAAVKISGDLFNNNAAEALDMEYDDYGPAKDKTVAQYLTEKLGPVGAGFVTNTVTSLLTSTFTKGNPSTFLAQQIIGNVTTGLKNYFDPNFKSQYVDPLDSIMDEAKTAATTYNDLANKQNALGEQINGDITKYNDRVSDLNDLVKERVALAAKYDGMNASNSTQAQVNALYKQIKDLDTQITSETSSINSFYKTHITDPQKEYAALNTQTLEAQKAYVNISDVLADKAAPLTKYINDTTKDMALGVAKTLDPSFNADEYRTLNGLSQTDDVGAHYISTGKDQGLYTNFADAQPQLEELQFKAMDKFASSMGYSGGAMSLPPSVYNDALDKMQSFYGNNLKAWTEFTPDSFLQQIKLPPTAVMPMWEAEAGKLTVAKVIYDNGEEQLVNITTQLPSGTQAATASQILKGQASVVRGDDGNFYWATSSGTASVYDSGTGNMIKGLVGPAREAPPEGATNPVYDSNGELLHYTDSSGNTITNITVSGSADDSPLTANTGTDINDVDPMMQMYTYSAMPDGIAANFNVKGIVQASKDIVDYMQKDASDIQKLQIATVVKSAGSVAQDVGTVLGDLSVAIGLSKTGDNSLTDIGKQLQGLADAKTPEQYQIAMKDIEAMRKNAQGTDIAGVNAAIAAKYPDLVGVSVFGGELFEEVIQNGIGKAAFVAGGALAATLGAPALITAGVASAFGYGTAMALDFAESYRGGKEDMYQRMYDIYKEKGYSDYQANQMADAAASKAGVMNGLITLAVNGAAPGDINKVLFGGKASPAQEAITNYFLDKVGTMVKVGVSEAVQGGVEGFLQGAYNESIVYGVDPKKADYWKGITDSAMLESIIGAPVAMGSYAIDNSFDAAKQTFTFANEAFTDAITNPNVHTVGELGSIVNKWVPTGTTEADQAFKNSLVTQVMEAVPTLSVNYANAGAYIDAIKNSFGVYETVAADIANADPKFAATVTSTSEATKLLESKGLTNVTAEDAAKAGIVGSTKTDQSTLADAYINQNMVSQAELQAAAKQENYTYTQAELDKLTGRGVEADVIAKFVQEIDPKAVTTAEATQWFKAQGYTKATAQEIAQFVKSAPETEVQAALTAYVDPHQVTRNEAIKFYAQNGIVPTEAQINKYVVQGADVAQTEVAKQIAAYTDPMYVSADEVRQAYKNLGVNAPVTMADVARLTGQYDESQLAAKAKESLPVVTSNASYAAMVGDKYAMQSVKDSIAATTAKIKALGYTDSEAQSAAVDLAAAQFGVSRANVLSALGTTEQNLTLDLNPTTDSIIAKVEQYVNRGMTPQNAVTAALDTVALGQGITSAQLLSKLGTTAGDFVTYATPKIDTTEAALAEAIARNETAGMSFEAAKQKAADEVATRFDIPVADVLTKIDTTSQQFQNKINIAQTDLDKQLVAISGGTQTATGQMGQMETQIQQVADLVGKPASQVTAADITNVQNMIANKTATNLGYDVNQDGKVDTQDLTLIQQQQQIETKQGVETQVDQDTGQTTYIDKATGKPITGFTAPEGSVWAPTGIYGEIAKNAAAQASAAKASQAQAKQAQQKQNFQQMMQMVLGSSDAGGRKVTVDTPPPSHINYIYDWNSWFANPQQAGLMPSPYGAVNTYGQPSQQGLGSLQRGMSGQAANQGTYGEPYKMAVGGFAEGGMINSDISVGDGGNIDDLLNILKGNSG